MSDDTHSPLVIGLVSDTHGLFRPRLGAALADVNLIIHAGDVGGLELLRQLSEIAPVEAVSGNVDDRRDPRLPRERTLRVGGLTIRLVINPGAAGPRRFDFKPSCARLTVATGRADVEFVNL